MLCSLVRLLEGGVLNIVEPPVLPHKPLDVVSVAFHDWFTDGYSIAVIV